MKQHKHPKTLSWFEQQNRSHLTFLVAVALIAILFVAALIGILSGRYKPFADNLQPGVFPKLNNALSVTGGSLKYKTPDGATKTATGNDSSITVQAISHAGVALQAADLSSFNQLNNKLTIYVDGSDASSAVIRNLVVGSDGKKTDDLVKLTIDTDSFRNPLDDLAAGTAVTVVNKPDFHLATKQSGITNLRDLGNFPVAGAGDANNDNTVNGADFAIEVQHFNQDVAPLGQFDANGDGKEDGADFAVWAANFGKTGEQL